MVPCRLVERVSRIAQYSKGIGQNSPDASITLVTALAAAAAGAEGPEQAGHEGEGDGEPDDGEHLRAERRLDAVRLERAVQRANDDGGDDGGGDGGTWMEE